MHHTSQLSFIPLPFNPFVDIIYIGARFILVFMGCLWVFTRLSTLLSLLRFERLLYLLISLRFLFPMSIFGFLVLCTYMVLSFAIQ